jgi:hypothetical protein
MRNKLNSRSKRYLFAIEMGLDGLLVVARTFLDGDASGSS